MAKQKLIIAALSSRVYVQAAVHAGFEVLAIDGFADMDTQSLAFDTRKIAFDECGFIAKALLKTLNELDLTQFSGFCYGAGFETQPALIAEIAKYLPILGNATETLQTCKNPQTFQDLCHAFEMLTPKTTFKRPINTLGWLSKVVGGSGGCHIKPLLPLDIPQKMPIYYQRVITGTSISCLFLADGVHAEVIGYSEQWCAPTLLSPYRYGGAVSQVNVKQVCKNTIETFIKAMSYKLSLRGINSADFLVDGTTVYALEFNPRLSATLDLYNAKRGNLFRSHVAACLGQLSDWPSVTSSAKAHHIIYASQTAKLSADRQWETWVCDIPKPSSIIVAGMPICTLLAEARTAHLAKKKVFARAASFG